jgi:hypothetical protein
MSKDNEDEDSKYYTRVPVFQIGRARAGMVIFIAILCAVNQWRRTFPNGPTLMHFGVLWAILISMHFVLSYINGQLWFMPTELRNVHLRIKPHPEARQPPQEWVYVACNLMAPSSYMGNNGNGGGNDIAFAQRGGRPYLIGHTRDLEDERRKLRYNEEAYVFVARVRITTRSHKTVISALKLALHDHFWPPGQPHTVCCSIFDIEKALKQIGVLKNPEDGNWVDGGGLTNVRAIPATATTITTATTKYRDKEVFVSNDIDVSQSAETSYNTVSAEETE